jgi:hypothetical protein
MLVLYGEGGYAQHCGFRYSTLEAESMSPIRRSDLSRALKSLQNAQNFIRFAIGEEIE